MVIHFCCVEDSYRHRKSKNSTMQCIYILWAIVYIVHMPFNCNTYWVWKFHLTTNTKVRQKIEKPQIEHCGFTSPFSGTLYIYTLYYIYIYIVLYIYISQPGESCFHCWGLFEPKRKVLWKNGDPGTLPCFSGKGFARRKKISNALAQHFGEASEFQGPLGKEVGDWF